MRPVEFTAQQIIDAGLALRDAGRNVTGFALRQRVGGGNPSRLKQVWDEYLASQSTATAEPVAELPVEVAEQVASVTSELTAQLARLATDLNDRAVKAAERRVAEVVRTAGEQREQAERELTDAAQTVDELEAQLDAAKLDADGLTQRLADTQGEKQALAVQLAQLKERLAASEQHAHAAAEQHAAELARAEEVAARLRNELDAVRTDAAGKLDALRAELGETTAQAKAAAQTHAEQRRLADEAHGEERKRTAAEAHRQAERFTQVQADRDVARKEAAQAREEAARQAGRLDALQAQNAELLAALKAKK
jgi:colicin import membrane protein